MVDIERTKIPAESKEGDVLIIKDEEIFIDKEETEKRKNK